MANLPGISTTAIGATLHVKCNNEACGKIFTTHEPFRLYCTLKCKEYAARRRRRLKEKIENEGHDPTQGRTDRERMQDHMEAAKQVTSAPRESTIDLEVKILYNAIVNEGRMDLLAAPHIHQEVKRRVTTLLAKTNLEEKAPTGANSYIVEEPHGSVMDVLKDVGLVSGDETLSEPIEEQPKTEAEKAEEL